jgi:hypothetical protein
MFLGLSILTVPFAQINAQPVVTNGREIKLKISGSVLDRRNNGTWDVNLYQLDVSGTNQYGQNANWSSGRIDPPVYEIQTNNWYWKGSVILSFIVNLPGDDVRVECRHRVSSYGSRLETIYFDYNRFQTRSSSSSRSGQCRVTQNRAF